MGTVGEITFQRLIIIITLTSLCFGVREGYFQQHVSYDIEVTLNDSAHTLEAFEKIVYTNHSPDTLTFICLQLHHPGFVLDKTFLIDNK